MADVFWDRIEPHNRDLNVGDGLAARIADPMWMLARQWQLGEFRGEDAASPIDMQLRVTHLPLASFRNEARDNVPAEPLNAAQPLESRVEAESLPTDRGRFALAADMGVSFLRRLDEGGLHELRTLIRQRFPLKAGEADLSGLQPEDKALVQLRTRNACDGVALLYSDVTDFGSHIPSELRGRAVAVWRGWREVQRRRFDQPGDSGETWVANRLEHRFSIATASDTNPVKLTASEYAGGRVDWYSFDFASGTVGHDIEVPDKRKQETVQEHQRLAVPLAYAGMPAARYWEFEDGSVYFGGIEGGPADIGRLLVAEYATIYSDDWFLIPVRLPIATLGRVDQVIVRNTFGERHVVRSCAALDRRNGSTRRPFAFFELSGDPSASNGETPWLPLIPSLANAMHGSALERVSFVRDEAANLAWACEERIETAARGSLPRRMLDQNALEESRSSRTAVSEPMTAEPPEDDAAWRYRLQTRVFPHWIPLLPERIEGRSPEVLLRRARLLAWDELEMRELAGPKGSVLTPHQPYFLHEEEIPRGGVQVVRRWQAARGHDGRLHIWISRQKRPGRGERSAGLEYDKTLRG